MAQRVMDVVVKAAARLRGAREQVDWVWLIVTTSFKSVSLIHQVDGLIHLV